MALSFPTGFVMTMGEYVGWNGRLVYWLKFSSSSLPFKFHILLVVERGLLFHLLDSLLVSSLLLSFYTSILSLRHMKVWGGVTIESKLGNTILVKLELWESVMVIISFGLPLTYAYATLRQSVAGNRHFGVLFFAI
jgi:hypothetical protein